LHVLSQQNLYEFVTILMVVRNIEKSEKSILVSNAQNTLQHLIRAFTTKYIGICYNFKARMQHRNIQRKNIFLGEPTKAIEHLASALTTKCIEVCIISSEQK
jgi:adenine-specific DNA methylase